MSPARRLLAALLLAPALAGTARGGDIVTDFEGGANPSGWAFIAGADIIRPTGGNPGAWLSQPLYDTFAPSLKVDGSLTSDYVGDYRARGVSRLAFDARTTDLDFGNGSGFEMSVLLRDTKGTPSASDDDYAYFVGPNIPLLGAGWTHYDFDIPSQDTSAVPAGWKGGWAGDGENFAPGVTWNDVIVSVDRVEIWWLDPALFAIFQQWGVGADNITLTEADRDLWMDLGDGLAGAGGVPTLTGSGNLTVGSTTTLTLTGAAPSAPAYLILSLAALNAPFKGGVLVPDPTPPNGLVFGLATDGSGSLVVTAPWPAGVPGGVTIYTQCWIPDAGGPVGFAASNALSASTP